MNQYHIRDIIDMSDEDVWDLPEEVHEIVFDDETVRTHTRATILTRYYLLFFVHYPDAPILAKWHVQNTGFDGGVQINVLSDVYWSVYEHYEDKGIDLPLDDLDVICMTIVQNMYNDLSVNIDEYMMSSSLFDLIEIMDHPKVKEVIANIVPTQHGIEEVAHKQIGDIITNDADLRRNPVQIGVRSRSYPVAQVLHCVSPRGFATDIDSAIGKYPIMTGYCEGIHTLYGSALESRSASKAILYNQELIQDTEYFNREMQMIASYLQNIVKGDCGSTSYVRQPILKDSAHFYIGKYYLTEDNTLGCITRKNYESLIGKRIKMRSILACECQEPGSVCEICYGRMSKQMVGPVNYNGVEIPGTVIGHVSATELCGTMTQLVFSTKHLDSTSHIDPFKLGDGEKHYLTIDADDNIYLKPLFKKRSYTLSFLSEQLHSITDLNVVDDPMVLKPRRVSQITAILVDLGKYDPLGYKGPVELRVYNHNRKPCLTSEALLYFKEKGWTQSQDGKTVTIDMSDWDVTKPFMVLPFVHVNLAEYKEEFKTFYYSSSSNAKKVFKGRNINKASDDTVVLSDFKDVSNGLAAFINLNPAKLGANIIHYEALTLVMMIRGLLQDDYRMPLNAKENGEFSVYSRIIANRSAGPVMAHERQDRALANYKFYGRTELDGSNMDSVLLGGADLN